MSLLLSDVIAGVRSRNPAFDRRLVTDKSLADFFTTEQRRLMTRALERDKQYLAQALTVAFDLSAADAPGTAGDGTSGGVPAQLSAAGAIAVSEETAGSLVTVATDGVATLVSDTDVVSATATSLIGLGAAWVVNAYVGKAVVITAGTGYGQPPRTIASNTANQLTWNDAWSIVPDSTSTFKIVSEVLSVDATAGAVTAVPSVSARTGFLVRLNANGVPYIDYTKPLTVSVEKGVPLPQFHSILGGNVRFTDINNSVAPLRLQSYTDRFAPNGWPAAYVFNQTLFLCGGAADWQDVDGIELHYVPIPPAFVARTDLFLLPDHSYSVLVARGAVFSALRLASLANAPSVAIAPLNQEASEAESAYLASIGLTRRARASRMREP
jgi:hypothetical protein